MTNRDDNLDPRLEAIDPARSEPPPVPGSVRFTSIKERAMSTSTSSAPAKKSPAPRRRIGQVAVAATAAAALGIGAFALWPGNTTTPTAVAAVQSAAEKTGDLNDFRVTAVSDDETLFPGGKVEGEFDGENFRGIGEDFEIIRVGDTEWITENGSLVVEPAGAPFLPMGQASEVILGAALKSKDVADRGPEDIRGVSTTRYDITLDDASRDALGDLPPEAQFLFEESVEVDVDADTGEETRFGGLEEARQINVWVADGLIHQISVDDAYTYTFYDFGADITVTAPQD